MLIGMWSGSQCGLRMEIAIVLNDEESPYKLKAVILNGKQIGYGFFDGHPWFYASPTALPGAYEGYVTYRNVLFQRWFPTRIVMQGPNVFVTYDDVTMRTCGGTIHTYVRKWSPVTKEVSRPASGSGFLLWKTALVLTADHVIESASRIYVRFSTGEKYEAHVVARDSINDLALLDLVSYIPGPRGFRINPRAIVRIGESAHVIGYPLAPRLGLQPSIVSGHVSSSRGLDDAPTQFRITAPVNPGNSGGPILNQEGEVIGIAVSAIRHRLIEGIAFGIKIAAAFPLLQRGKVRLEWEETAQLNPEQIFSRYSPDVVLIEAQ